MEEKDPWARKRSRGALGELSRSYEALGRDPMKTWGLCAMAVIGAAVTLYLWMTQQSFGSRFYFPLLLTALWLAFAAWLGLAAREGQRRVRNAPAPGVGESSAPEGD